MHTDDKGPSGYSMTLCLFLNTGRTVTFQEVEILHDNETAITFVYRAMSDGRQKRATFYKAHVAGVSRTI